MAKWKKPEGFTGYRFDLENQPAILERSMSKYERWRRAVREYAWDPPAEIDPREWYDIQSQGNIGACQGNALADCTEYCYWLEYGPEIQLSRFWAYIISQEADGISGDSGSTLEGGGRAAAARGICLEESFPYPSNYSSGLAFYRANKDKLKDEAARFKLKGEVPIATWADAVTFLKTWSGVIQTGLMWGSSCDVAWEQKSYTPGSGGHSTTICGYLKVEGWPDGIGLLHKNSWGTGWGREGWTLIHKNAIDSMLKARNNLFVGRARPESPQPQPKPDI